MNNTNNYGLQTAKNKKIILCWAYAFFMLFMAILSMQVSTQFIAYKLNYQKALGKALFEFFDMPIYAFWNVFHWDYPNIQSIYDKAIEYGQMTFIFPQLVVLASLLYIVSPKGNKKLHGSATWAKEKEITSMGYFSGEGVYVGSWQKKEDSPQLYLRHNGPEHILCFAPTRSGKGVGLILPTLLSWQGSSIVLDIKGENWALTSGYRKSIGHKVLRFDPTDTSGSACKFNPLDEVRLDTYFAIQDVQNMAMMIVDPDGKGLADHWTKAAFAFFSGIILHCCVMVKSKAQRSATMQDISLMMSGYGYDEGIKSLLEEMLEVEHLILLKDVYPNIDENVCTEINAFIVSCAKEMVAKADGEASGVVSSALVNMALYKDPVINLNTCQSDFRIDDLMNSEEPVDLYLVLSPASIDRVRPLVRLMTDMIIRRICKEMAFKDGSSVKGYKHRLLLMLDEFTSLGKLPIIEKAIAYIAGYGGKMYLIVQDITQLNGVYGKENALMANCHTRIAYAPNTIETAKVLSEMSGKTTVVEKKTSVSYSKGGRSRSVNISETARPLLTPDECMRLPTAEKDVQGRVLRPGHMLIFTAGQSPIYGVQILYFRDPVFMQRAKMLIPGQSEKYPNGISDSLYYPRPEDWYELKQEPKTIEEIKQEDIEEIAEEVMEDITEDEVNFDDYLENTMR